jgi:hypothetical protein
VLTVICCFIGANKVLFYCLASIWPAKNAAQKGGWKNPCLDN